MMTPKKKRHMTYVTIGIFFLLQGVEYAVILPTLWLYIETKFNGKPYMLGVVLSAFSIAGLISSPLMGRWSDRTGNTKQILLLANVIQFVGSIMYFMGQNVWFLVGARFVAGLGSGVGSALFADIARVTSSEERTAVMSMFMAVRQIGLLAGPGCNLFLRHFNFYIGPFIADKYTSPGLFLAAAWLLHEILTVFMYWNLPKLKLEERVVKEQQESISQSTHSRILAASRLPNIESPLIRPISTYNASPRAPRSDRHRTKSASSKSKSRVRPQQHSRSDMDDDPAYLTSSNEIIETAERLMGRSYQPDEPTSSSVHGESSDAEPALLSNSLMQTASTYGATATTQENVDSQHVNSNNFSGLSGEEYLHITNISNEEENLLDNDVQAQTDVVQRSQESHSKKIKITVRFFYQEFIREEIVAILFTGFVAFFNQVGMETLFTPLSQKLLDWGELENSILYCAAGAEVIAVFFLVRFLSRYLEDRWLLLLGFAVLTVTIAVLTWFLPQARLGHYTSNFAGLVTLVFFDVFALPFLAVPSASLFSKITREETQGFAQGVRRMSIGLGTILGPLWAGSMLNHLLFSFIIMLLVCAIAMLMLLMSFKYLKDDQHKTHSNSTKKSSADILHSNSSSVNVRSWEETEGERAPLLHHSA